eukprot:366380-Chlamydomonas_euryale.AAC.7
MLARNVGAAEDVNTQFAESHAGGARGRRLGKIEGRAEGLRYTSFSWQEAPAERTALWGVLCPRNPIKNAMQQICHTREVCSCLEGFLLHNTSSGWQYAWHSSSARPRLWHAQLQVCAPGCTVTTPVCAPNR